MGPFSPQSGILHGILTFLIDFLMYLICIGSVVLTHSEVVYRCVWLELRRLPQILLVLVRRTIN